MNKKLIVLITVIPLLLVQKLFAQSYLSSSDGKIIFNQFSSAENNSTNEIFTSDSLLVKIKLDNITDSLTFNQSHVPDYAADYWWGVRFDADSNSTTGPNGCEIEIALAHHKPAGDVPFKSNIVDGSNHHEVIEWIGSSGIIIDSNVTVSIDSTDFNTLVLSVPKSISVIANINEGVKWYVHSFYFSKSGVLEDMTSPVSGTNVVNDARGDVIFSFIDILQGQIFVESPTFIEESNESTQPKFYLHQNYPNPFNPSTTIAYSISHRSHVTLTIYNTLGQQIATLVDSEINSGQYEVTFDGSHLASGIYFYRLQVGTFTQIKKLVLLR